MAKTKFSALLPSDFNKENQGTGVYEIKHISSHVSSESVLKPRDPNRPFVTKYSKDSKVYYPIPKGDSVYALGKKAEYIEKNLEKAADLYLKAINSNDRAESAIKDLVGVLHQQGKTFEALEILQKHENLFTNETEKYENIYKNLHQQLMFKGNRFNKLLKISPVKPFVKASFISSLFSKPQRINEIKIHGKGYAILNFSSHSAARKTLESFRFWEKYKIEWVNVDGEVIGDAYFRGEIKVKKPKVYQEKKAKNSEDEIFEFSQKEAEEILGKDLLACLNN
ncbi:unnamed protein product [Blepharisma stoltei]|uniref:RRM domain-containing protein n=1 Tax=Blepharisma stoltei TaxID=1481888 RepID=A0AAU9IQG5_9CILI|nr:unnamed protein product [Blepharisma stoltei]